MLARQRQDFIMDLVTRNGGVRVAEVVEALGISEMTVRRDITELVSRARPRRRGSRRAQLYGAALCH